MYRLVLLPLLFACNRDGVDTAKGGDSGASDDTAEVPPDEDGDGYLPSEGDCDDGDRARYPGAPEACNGVDDNCDGVIDEDVLGTYFADADGDGFGDAGAPTEACDAPDGYVADDGDCDDTDAARFPGAPEPDCADPVDYNCDGSAGDADADADGFVACEDCDDADADVSPAAAETCNDGDDDCDGEVDEAGSVGEATWHADADGDGFGDGGTALLACEAPEGWIADATDCDDAVATTHPAAAEACNAVDDDCDGAVDEDAVDAPTWYADADADGYGDAGSVAVACDAPAGTVADDTDCDDTLAEVHPAGAETCNDRDDDCDGRVDDDATDVEAWYYDGDGDGYGNPYAYTTACDAPAGYAANADDCNDGAALASPAGTETCDGLDNDCDGEIDEGGGGTYYRDADGDGYGDLATAVTACSAPAGYVATSTDCDDAAASVSPAAAEACDGADNDCDGSVDETGGLTFYADADRDGYGDPASVIAGCTLPTGYAANDDDCDDTLAAVSPAATESCDGVDEDCDGAIDDGAGDVWYRDADGDGYGIPGTTTRACSAPSGYAATADDCDDGSSSYSPGAAEVCDDALDQDCDGTADDGCPDVIEHCGTISSDETWSGEDLHVVTCDVYVQGTSAPTLTIEDGARVEFSPGTGLIVGWSSYGELWVDGHTDGVTFTSSDSRPAAGDWDGLTFGRYDRGSWLEGATVGYGGENGYGNVYAINTPLLTLVDSVIHDGSASGVYATGAEIDVSGTTVEDNATYGVYLATTSELTTTGGATFGGNTLTGNGSHPLVVPAPYVGAIDATNTFVGNGSDAVYVHSGSVTSSATWWGLDVPYYLAGDVTVGTAAGMELAIEDGAVLQFASGAALNVGTSSYVDFLVRGTAAGVVFTSARATPRAGDWDGIYVGPSAERVEIDGATIAYGGANGYGNLYVYYGPDTVLLTDTTVSDSSTSGVYLSWYANLDAHGSTFRDNAAYGLYVLDAATLDGDLAFTGNTVTGNDVGVSIPAQEGGALGNDGVYAGNVSDDVEVRSDTIATSVTFRDLDAPYHVVGDVNVAGTTRPTLTIEDGVEFRFQGNAGLTVGSGGYGGLDVQGSVDGVLFTSDAAVPAPGDWDGLTTTWYNVGTTLRGATIEYGGGNGYGNLYANPASFSGGTVVVEDCVVRDSSESGIYAASTTDLHISGTTVEDNADYGVYLDTSSALETTGEPTFTGNTIAGNGLHPLVLPISSLDQLDATSSYSGNGTDRVFVNADTVAESGTWQALDVPYYVSGDTWIQGAGTPVITVEPGATFLFNTLASIAVAPYSYGKLVAVGTVEEPIVFTSAQATPAPGDWDGLQLGAYDAGSRLQYVEVSYGGNYLANVYVTGNGSRVTIADATVSYSESYGIRRGGGATPSLSGITYVGNTTGDLY